MTRIKICGLRQEADVSAAVAAGADAIGFVFYAKSPRAVTPEQAHRLARLLPPFVTPVGLFVNASDDELQSALQAVPNMLVQFHGDETPAECERLARPYLRAARMAPGFDLLNFGTSFSNAQAILLDAFVDGYGGGGKVFDWSLLPRSVPFPVVLSGGLSAANVGDGIARLGPWAVDVSSGVEIAKGVKDPALIQEFCRAVRRADAELAELDR